MLLGRILGVSWASWGRLEASWARLGGVLGASCAVLERLGRVLLARLGRLLGPALLLMEPDLTWNGKRRLFCCAFYVSLRFSISFCFFLFLFACVIAPLASLAAIVQRLCGFSVLVF